MNTFELFVARGGWSPFPDGRRVGSHAEHNAKPVIERNWYNIISFVLTFNFTSYLYIPNLREVFCCWASVACEARLQWRPSWCSSGEASTRRCARRRSTTWRGRWCILDLNTNGMKRNELTWVELRKGIVLRSASRLRIAYPAFHRLPVYDPARQELEEREELDGASELQCVLGPQKLLQMNS